ncbi:hypothetical protein RHGRI_030481 [Rhododendron griersonianum]|uniref:Uncharacterized protein n=1 Tax=Rhododendron griersonianum TaxID=479676 RepID=A0AAV6INE5_9ERIC|nr:hypothetical protein RHGRI_030481 [Rhododendron griersonianum]
MAYLEICNSKAQGLYSNPEFMGFFLRCLNDSETKVEVEPTGAATVRNFRLAKNRWLRMIYGFEEKMLSAFREVERSQANCFPKVGEIRADGLMIYCQIVLSPFLTTNNASGVCINCAFFYHLPDSLPIKHVFQEEKGTWFIHMEVCTWRVSDKLCLPECPAAQIRDQTSKTLVSTLMTRYRRPIDRENLSQKMVNLVDSVWGLYSEGKVVEAADERLMGEFEVGVNGEAFASEFDYANLDSFARPSL